MLWFNITLGTFCCFPLFHFYDNTSPCTRTKENVIMVKLSHNIITIIYFKEFHILSGYRQCGGRESRHTRNYWEYSRLAVEQ